MTDVTLHRPQVAARRITPADIPTFAEHLLGSARFHPKVAVTTFASTGKPHLDPDRLAALLGSLAAVLLLEAVYTTWALSQALPEKFDVHGGAVRVWWPGLSRAADPYSSSPARPTTASACFTGSSTSWAAPRARPPLGSGSPSPTPSAT